MMAQICIIPFELIRSVTGECGGDRDQLINYIVGKDAGYTCLIQGVPEKKWGPNQEMILFNITSKRGQPHL